MSKTLQFILIASVFLVLCSLVTGDVSAAVMLMIMALATWGGFRWLINRTSKQGKTKSVTNGATSRSYNLTFTSSWELREGVFIKAAKKYAHRKGQKTKFVPFKTYYSSYTDMNQSQMNWYFYWRDQARKGNYLPTSLSYIFVNAYELINQVGIKNTEDGYNQLVALWLRYRQEEPKLDNYLGDWIADYIAVYKLPIRPLDAYLLPEITQRHTVVHFDYLFTHYLTNNLLDQLPLFMICSMGKYRGEKSKFYERHPIVFEKTLQGIISSIDRHAESGNTSVKKIFHQLRSEHLAEMVRQPFRSAIYANSSGKPVTIGKVYQNVKTKIDTEYIQGVIKYTENLLRDQYGIRGRLKVSNLDDKTKTFIDGAIGYAAPPQSVELAIGSSGTVSAGVPIPVALNFIESFIEQGHKFVDESSKSAKFTRFNSSRPTYAILNTEQKEWYLYWREEVRNDRYPQTDVGYLRLYGCELVNGIGVDPSQCIDLLKTLAMQYNSKFEAESLVLLSWAAAVASMNQDTSTPLAVLTEVGPYLAGNEADSDIQLHHYLTSNLALSPSKLWQAYIDFDLSQSRAIKGELNLLMEHLPFVIDQVNQYLVKLKGVSLFEQHRPTEKFTFSVAPCHVSPPRWPTQIKLKDVLLYSSSVRLRSTLTGITKNVENILRKKLKVNGRLTVKGLDADLSTQIDKFVQIAINPNRKKRIEIDFGRVEVLAQETDAILDLLVIDDAQPDTISHTMETEEPYAPVSIPSATDETNLLNTGQNYPKKGAQPEAVPGVDAEWLDLMSQLNAVQVELLQLAISDEANLTATVNQLAANNHLMPALLLDSLNEIAQDTIGDILLDAGPPIEIVDSYYTEMIQKVLNHRNNHDE